MSNTAKIYNVEGYYNRFDSSKNYEKLLARAGYIIQSPETNDMQEAFLHRIKGIADALFKDGDIVQDAQISVNISTGQVQAESGLVYINGGMRSVPAASFQIPLVGQVSVGIYLTEKVVSELEDPELKNPAVGTRGEGAPGAWRLQVNAAWGYFNVGTKGDFYLVYTVDDGIVRPKETPPTLDTFNQGIARYDRDSTGGGTYISSGFMVRTAKAIESGAQIYTISEGRCRVHGNGIDQLTSRRLSYEAVPDLKFFDTEVITATNEATQRINVAHAPIHNVTALRVTLEKTVSVVHGAYSGVTDALSDASILSLVSVSQGDTVFEQGTDYVKNGDSVDWSPNGIVGGNEPAPGSTYSVTYHYLDKTRMPENPDYDGFYVSNAVPGSSIMVSYNQAVQRVDVLCITVDGAYTWVKGVPNELNPKKPTVPTTSLALASIYQNWRGNTQTVINDGVRVVPFADIEALSDRVDYALQEIARQRLESDVTTREAGARVGLFVDPLLDDSMRDQGLEQSAAVVDGILTLPITAKVFALSNDVAVPTARNYAPKVILEQTFKTGSMKVNPYMAFEPLPAPVTLTPSVDRWTETQTNWTSAVTRVFGSGNVGRTSTRTELVSSTTSDIEHLRPIEVAFSIRGFGNGEILQSIIFDGVEVVAKEGTLIADVHGELQGTFDIPEHIPAGAKIVEFSGNGSNGAATFVGQGTLLAETLRTVQTVTRWNSDPLAQTFTLDRDTQLAGIDLWFTAKNTEARVQIRHVENGVPTRVVLAEKRILAADIVISGAGHTRVLFDAPVALSAATEYAFVVLCDDADTSLAIAELGQFDAQKQQWVASQPYTVGVLLSSANASTWTPHQTKDLCFRLLEADFTDGIMQVNLGTAVLDMQATDVVLLAASEIPSANAGIEYELGLEDGTVFTVAESQPIRFTSKNNGAIVVKAKLSGDAKASPVLWPGSQLLAGQVQESADYFTRSIATNGATKALLIYDAFIPSGASVTPQIQVDSDAFQAMQQNSTVEQGDGLVEFTHSLTLSGTANIAKVKLTLEGTLLARPYVQNIRFMAIK